MVVKNSVLARTLLSSRQRWCDMCQCPVDVNKLVAHRGSGSHRQAVHKFRNLKTLADSMWAGHRRAALTEESARMPAIQRELKMQQTQRARPFRPPR
jgi:hypothetical protein